MVFKAAEGYPAAPRILMPLFCRLLTMTLRSIFSDRSIVLPRRCVCGSDACCLCCLIPCFGDAGYYYSCIMYSLQLASSFASDSSSPAVGLLALCIAVRGSYFISVEN